MTDAVSTYLELQIAAGRMPGAAWWAGGPAGPRSEGAVGLAVAIPSPQPATATTPYDLASLTKPLATALVAALLEAEGRLDLDAPAVRWLPELAGSPYAPVTLDELGTHRAGLPAWRPIYVHASSREGYLARIAAEPPAVSRGETLYSDLGYLLLGVAVERAGGETMDVLFDTRVAGPLGTPSVGFAGRGNRFAAAAATEAGNLYERVLAGAEGAGFAFRAAIPRGQVHDGNAWGLGGVAGHAGLFGDAAAVARIARAILDPPSVWPRGARFDRMLRRRAPGERTFGWVLAEDSPAAAGVLPDAAVGHYGFTGTSIWLDPGTGRAFVLLTNRVHPRVPPADFAPVRRGFHAACVTTCG